MVKKLEPNFHFRLMSIMYKFRDFFVSRTKILKEVGIEEKLQVLDYGCGPGSYIAPLARLVGASGKIFALDIHPLAIKMVQRLVSKKHLTNVITIQSDCQTGLPDESVDVSLLYDVFHDLEHPGEVLKELHRILKPNGILSLSDHHLQEKDIVSGVTEGGLFRLVKKGQRTYTFQKIG
jgi:ubiquinone/menaquinone biosynthesis C-methylase UbiE